MKRLVFATHNRGKLVELRTLLSGLSGVDVDVVSLAELGIADDVVEDGATFYANAKKKAEAALARTGLPSLADDSGLEVDALGGAPGVKSARYAGEPSSDGANNALLLDRLRDHPPPRTARFRCVLALALSESPSVHFEEGTLEGEIALAPRGHAGFGYDPLFLPHAALALVGEAPVGETRYTLAELSERSLDEKNRISHRGQAMRRMAERLRRL